MIEPVAHKLSIKSDDDSKYTFDTIACAFNEVNRESNRF